MNQYIQEVRADGGDAKVVPQLQRLISLGSYRLRDVQKMRQIASDPKKLQDYVYAVNASGEPISGEKAVERYAIYSTSPIYREPAKEVDMMVDNVATTVEQTFVDLRVSCMMCYHHQRTLSGIAGGILRTLTCIHPVIEVTGTMARLKW